MYYYCFSIRISATLRNDGSLEENSSAELLFQRKNRINVKKKIKRAGWKGSEAFLPSPLNIRVCRGAEGREKREEGEGWITPKGVQLRRWTMPREAWKFAWPDENPRIPSYFVSCFLCLSTVALLCFSPCSFPFVSAYSRPHDSKGWLKMARENISFHDAQKRDMKVSEKYSFDYNE